MEVVYPDPSIESCKYVAFSCLRSSSGPDVSIPSVSLHLIGRFTSNRFDLQVDVQLRWHVGALKEPDDTIAKILDLLGRPTKVCREKRHTKPVEGLSSSMAHGSHVTISERSLIWIRLVLVGQWDSDPSMADISETRRLQEIFSVISISQGFARYLRRVSYPLPPVVEICGLSRKLKVGCSRAPIDLDMFEMASPWP